MRFAEAEPGIFIVRLESGEEIVSSLETFCRDQEIANAAIRGIGSVENPILAHYRKDKKAYSEKQLTGIFEIAALEGNVSMYQQQPLVHVHAVVSDEQMQTAAGHLVKGECSATVELFVHQLDSHHGKIYDEAIGLKLWDLPDEA